VRRSHARKHVAHTHGSTRVLTQCPAAPLLDWREPREATLDDMATVHDRVYLESVHAASAEGKRYGASTVLPAGGWLGVSLSAGAALDAAELVLSGAATLAYCLMRPPGHHASRAAVDGYCFVNNVALAAQRAVAAGHRVAVIDFDVHHGNGTQQIFYDRNDVLCVSLHMDQGAWDEGTSHPETGAVDEVGAGDGIGFNVNVPLPMGCGDSAYQAAFESVVVPEVDAFAPTFIVVACGVDGAMLDPNGTRCGGMPAVVRLRSLMLPLALALRRPPAADAEGLPLPGRRLPPAGGPARGRAPRGDDRGRL
jgi:acetoin utilization deacetylase AcuC-like enzyme